MNMIKVNFIPQESRKDRSNLWQDGFGALPREVIIGIFVAAAGVLVGIHILLFVLTLAKVGHYTMLQVRWGSLGAEKKAMDDIINETKTLQTKMNALKPVTSAQGLVWAKLMNEVSDSVPKGLWIRDLRFDKGVLVISGSAVSRSKDEMIIVNNFVSALKERPGLKEIFTGIDVDSINRRDNTALSIADFSLKAKRKAP